MQFDKSSTSLEGAVHLGDRAPPPEVVAKQPRQWMPAVMGSGGGFSSRPQFLNQPHLLFWTGQGEKSWEKIISPVHR